MLTPKKSILSKSLEVIVDPKLSTADYDNLTLPGTIETKEFKFSTVFDTTGRKDVGTPASGKVVIFNKEMPPDSQLDSKKTFKAGTVLTSGDLKFVLKKDTEVSFATENSGSRTYGEAEVEVEASFPGEKGNLSKDTTLEIEGKSKNDFEAKVIDGLTGGTSKTVNVFSAEDEKNAAKNLRSEILVAANKEFGTSSGDKYFLLQEDKLKIVSQKFDVKVDEEAKEVKVDFAATIPVIVYQLEELEPLAVATLTKDLPVGYRFVGDQPSLLSAVDESKTANAGDKIYITVDVSQEVEADLDLTILKTQILGQPLTKVDNLLRNDSSLKSYQITWSNSIFPKISGKIPATSGKVTLELVKN